MSRTWTLRIEGALTATSIMLINPPAFSWSNLGLLFAVTIISSFWSTYRSFYCDRK